jgi:hypothetical protein
MSWRRMWVAFAIVMSAKAFSLPIVDNKCSAQHVA